MTSDKTLYKLEPLKFGFKQAILSISFHTPSDNCLMVLDLIVSGVKYHFLFDFQ